VAETSFHSHLHTVCFIHRLLILHNHSQSCLEEKQKTTDKNPQRLARHVEIVQIASVQNAIHLAGMLISCTATEILY